MGHELSREISKYVTQMAEKHLKCSTSLVTREMQMETTLRFHLYQSEQPMFSKIMTAHGSKAVGKEEHSFSAGGSVNRYITSGDWSGCS